MCARHIYANWRKKYTNKKLQKKWWRCAKASCRVLFNLYRAYLTLIRNYRRMCYLIFYVLLQHFFLCYYSLQKASLEQVQLHHSIPDQVSHHLANLDQVKLHRAKLLKLEPEEHHRLLQVGLGDDHRLLQGGPWDDHRLLQGEQGGCNTCCLGTTTEST
jgi:hypothetical protein